MATKAKNVSDSRIIEVCNAARRKHYPTLESAAKIIGMKPNSLYQRMNKMRKEMLEAGGSQAEVDELLPAYSTASGGAGKKASRMAVVDMFAVLRNFKAQAEAEAAAELDPSLEGDDGDEG